MDEPAESSCANQLSRGAEDCHRRFIDRHRQLLLRYLDGTMPPSPDVDALGYVESVLTEWDENFRDTEISDPDPRERAFWFALYQFEELAERSGPEMDPYQKILMQHLAEVRELLRHQRPLPQHRFIATRPDGR